MFYFRFGEKLFGIGCLCHICNNALKNATDKLDFGAERLNSFLGQIHLFFQHNSADRISNINRIRVLVGCQQAYSSNRAPTKSFSKTRWLSTGPAIDAIINQWDLFDVYFQAEQTGKGIEKFKDFFQNKHNYPLLIVLKSIASDFEDAVLRMEGKEVTLVTSITIFEELRRKMVERQSVNPPVRPAVVDDLISNWEDDEKESFNDQLFQLYEDIYSYMAKWTVWIQPLMLHLWATLDAELSEDAVLLSAEAIKSSCQINADVLKENIHRANTFISSQLESWMLLSTSPSERWVHLFLSVPDLDELESAANYILTLPGTNATIERLFSEIRNYWDDSKDQMTLATVNTIMKIRFNFERDCNKVLQMLIEDSGLRREMRFNQKYNEAKLEEANSLVNLMDHYRRDDVDMDLSDLMSQDLASDQSSDGSDLTYEDGFCSDSTDELEDDEVEVHQSELDLLFPGETTEDVPGSLLFDMEIEEVSGPDFFAMEVVVPEPTDTADLIIFSPIVLDCLEFEHNYTEPFADSQLHHETDYNL